MPDLSSRVRPPQVLLAVGAVLLVAGAVAPSDGSRAGAGLGLLVGAVAAAAGSAWASGAGLRGTRETLAATAVVLAAAGLDGGGPVPAGSPAGPALLALALVAVSRLQPGPLAWPLGAWAVGQLAAVRALADVPAGVPRTCALLGVALAGLAVVLGARRSLSRIALLTTVPWWVAGAAGGTVAAWSGDAAWVSAGLTVAAAAGLLVVRLEPDVAPLLGPPRAIPLLAGLVAGAAVAGALSAGPGTQVAAGYAGVLLAATAAALLGGWRRGLLLPPALAAGATLLACALVQLGAAAAWRGLALLLVLTAVPAAAVARWRREDRPAAVPAAVGCLAAAVLLGVPAGLVAAPVAAGLLTALYVGALAGGSRLPSGTRRPTIVVGAVAAGAAVLLALGSGGPGALGGHLAVQGAATWCWALVVGRVPAAGPEAAAGRRVGAAELVLAAWIAAAAGGGALEAYTLPAAAGLLMAAGPRLRRGPSEPAWGPGLVVAAAPSTVLAVLEPGALRPLAVLVLAAAAMVGGATAGVRAPLLVGAGTAVALAAGLAVTALPLPLAGAMVAGTALVVLGARRELRPVGAFADRLADMR